MVYYYMIYIKYICVFTLISISAGMVRHTHVCVCVCVCVCARARVCVHAFARSLNHSLTHTVHDLGRGGGGAGMGGVGLPTAAHRHTAAHRREFRKQTRIYSRPRRNGTPRHTAGS